MEFESISSETTTCNNTCMAPARYNGDDTGLKLKFYLFPLTQPTLEKSPYPKNFITIFSQELIFF